MMQQWDRPETFVHSSENSDLPINSGKDSPLTIPPGKNSARCCGTASSTTERWRLSLSESQSDADGGDHDHLRPGGYAVQSSGCLQQDLSRGKRKRTGNEGARGDGGLDQKEEMERLVDMDKVMKEALRRTEESGIIFLDEIDKIASRGGGGSHGPEVSREGVQRDLLPIVEGATVTTKHGMVKTDHILFIASGAFHVSKPSDLIPELQGRFPIRVELHSLGKEEFVRILTEPENALTKQYIALMETEGIELIFEDEAIEEIAAIAVEVNETTEEIGARRLHTVMERVLDELSFDASELDDTKFVVTAEYVRRQLSDIVKDQDLSRFIL